MILTEGISLTTPMVVPFAIPVCSNFSRTVTSPNSLWWPSVNLDQSEPHRHHYPLNKLEHTPSDVPARA
jgi:hypothetical protein